MQFKTLLKYTTEKYFLDVSIYSFCFFNTNNDKKIIVFIAFVISVFTEVFVGLSAFIAAIPIIGPMIIKIVTIPFWYSMQWEHLCLDLQLKRICYRVCKGRI